jgi:hypothetical protein
VKPGPRRVRRSNTPPIAADRYSHSRRAIGHHAYVRRQWRFWNDVVGFGVYCALFGYAIASAWWMLCFIATGPFVVCLYRMVQAHGPGAVERQEMAERRRQSELQYEQEQTHLPNA